MKAIVAYDFNRCIGIGNQLLYNIPEDMRYFRQMSLHHGTVIMGSKTFESLNSKPLSNRTNIIISKNKTIIYDKEGVFNTWDFFNKELLISLFPDALIAGGEQIYNLFKSNIDYIYATEIRDDTRKGNKFFYSIDKNEYLKILIKSVIATDSTPGYDFCIYIKKSAYPEVVANITSVSS